MKRLKNYFRSLELIKVEEKKISKEVRNAAKDSTALKTFFLFLPIYLIIGNIMFMFLHLFNLLVLVINLFVFFNVYFYQYMYYKTIELKGMRVIILKTIIYGLIINAILWVIAYIVGGFIWTRKNL